MVNNELDLIFDVLKKCHVSAKIIQFSMLENSISNFSRDISNTSSVTAGLNVPDSVAFKTVYKLTDSFEHSYIFFALEENSQDIVLIGPFLKAPIPQNKLAEISKRNFLLPKQEKFLEKHYTSVSIIGDESSIHLFINSFCERAWNTPTFAIVEINKESRDLEPLIENLPKEENFDEFLADMKAMEKRYAYENELISAVTLGQVQKESLFNNSFNDVLFEKRVDDPLRNAKNYCIIMNTLLRKAAEDGGVHPIYIDRISSGFASRIEATLHLSEVAPLMKNIFKTYCSLVREHTMKNYSSLVESTLLLIDSDVSAPLSPSELAKAQNVSLGHLSTIFHKETGKTITSYILDKRMAHARHLLSTTKLQIQSVAARCGILDLQYFSKVFKKATGKTPKQYREAHNGFAPKK